MQAIVLPPTITPSSIDLVRSLLPLPPELTIPILDYAEYWADTTVTSNQTEPFQVNNATVPFLTTPPIDAGGLLTHPLRRVIVTTVSRDQGWSSYPQDRGTYNNSWTWFELSLNAPASNGNVLGQEKWRGEVVRNRHAHDEYIKHIREIEDEDLYDKAEPGDTLTVWAAALFPGWNNHVKKVSIQYHVSN